MKTSLPLRLLLRLALLLGTACAGSDTNPDSEGDDTSSTPASHGDAGVSRNDASHRDSATSPVPLLPAGDASAADAIADAAVTDAALGGLLGLLPAFGVTLPGALGGTSQWDMPPPSGPPYTGPGPGKPKCMRKDSQLMVIGDSYINWVSHDFPGDIARESGQQWRMLAVGGYSMATGGLGSIPDEFYNSIASDPDAHTILMDGGGNDILLPDSLRAPLPMQCTNTGCSKDPACQEIVKLALNRAAALMVDAAAKGIRDVVYFFYPHIPANTILSGSNPTEMVDYALPIARKTCADALQTTQGKLRCTFIDTVPLFAGHSDWFNSDIHESEAGAVALTKYIWQVMSDACIGQKVGAACCE